MTDPHSVRQSQLFFHTSLFTTYPLLSFLSPRLPLPLIREECVLVWGPFSPSLSPVLNLLILVLFLIPTDVQAQVVVPGEYLQRT